MDIFMRSLLRVCYLKACREEDYPASLLTSVCSLVFVQGVLNDRRKDAFLRHQVLSGAIRIFFKASFFIFFPLPSYCGCQFNTLCPAQHIMKI